MDMKRQHLFNCLVLGLALAANFACLPKSLPTEQEPAKKPQATTQPVQTDKKQSNEDQKKTVPRESDLASQSPKVKAVSAKFGELRSLARGHFLKAGVADLSMSAPQIPSFHTEEYDPINENGFREVSRDPLSTFSIDVDVASYANTRRFLTQNQLPPKDAVRVEEFINYFSYNYAPPRGDDPVSLVAEAGPCPWARDHKLVLLGLKAKEMSTKNLPPTRLVFLIDVSGSMQDENKLPLLKSAFGLLVDQLRAQDTVAVVVYAGSAGLVLPPTCGSKKDMIRDAIGRLEAGGSTAGGEGIKLAYEIAKKNFLKGGNNRVILATDGDFNVGVSSDGELVRLIEEKRKDDIFLTVLGFGMGNYKDSKMEKLADSGNGNYAYIDTLLEARKVLVSQMGGTLFTVAKDVKIQVEFNPAVVQAYRLIGYENRLLKNEEFNDDKKDAGDMGAGHTVTALYEVIPVGVKTILPTTDPLKYQTPAAVVSKNTDEMLTVKFRYKNPTEDKSRMIAHVLENGDEDPLAASENLRFATTVASFGMLLRDSEYKGSLTYAQVADLAKGALGDDKEGYRAEFLRLVKVAGMLSGETEQQITR